MSLKKALISATVMHAVPLVYIAYFRVLWVFAHWYFGLVSP